MRDPDILVRSDFDPALAWMIFFSVVLHVAAIILVLALPEGFFRHAPPLASYTVELTAGNELGGTNIGGSGGGKKASAVLPQAPPRPVLPPPPKPAEKPSEQKAAPEPPKPVEKAVPAAPIEKPKEPPKAEKPPEPVKPPEQAKPPPAQQAKVAVPAPIEKPKPAPPEEKVETKPAPVQQAKAVPAEARPAVSPKGPTPPTKGAAKPEAEKAKPATSGAKSAPGIDEEAQQRDRMIAAAVQRRAEAAAKQTGAGGGPGIGGGAGTGPASIGPGQGAGGILKGIEWVMYMRQLEAKVKENWVWTVKDGTRVAEVRFQVLPTGEVVNTKITKPSGDRSFDASVERAVTGASPLPPPPERYRNEFGADGVLLTFNETESRF